MFFGQIRAIVGVTALVNAAVAYHRVQLISSEGCVRRLPSLDALCFGWYTQQGSSAKTLLVEESSSKSRRGLVQDS